MPGEPIKPEVDPVAFAEALKGAQAARGRRRMAEHIHIGPVPQGEPARIEAHDLEDQYGVGPFPSDALPKPLQALIAHYASKRGLPEHVVTAMALCVIGASVRHRIAAKSMDSDFCRPNLQVLFAAPSGVGKSNVLDDLTFPIEEAHKHRLLNYRIDRYADLKIREVASDKTIRAYEGAKGKAPSENDYRSALKEKDSLRREMRCSSGIHGNATEEGLFAEMALDNGWAFSKTDECSSQLSILMGQYSGTVGGELYVNGYNSKAPVRRTRKGTETGPEEIIPIMSVLWCTQPDQIPRLASCQRLMEGGFVPRLITLAYTGALGTFASRNGSYNPKLEGIFYELVAGLEVLYLAEDLPPDEREKTLMLEREDGVEAFWKTEADRIKLDGQLQASRAFPFLLRAVEQGIKIAIVLHLVKHALRNELPHLHPITLDTATRGLRLAEWYARSSADLYVRVDASKATKDARKLVKMLKAAPKHSLSIRQVTRQSTFLAGDVQGIVDTWEPHGVFQLTSIHTGKSGNPPKHVALVADEPKLISLGLSFPPGFKR